MLNSKSKLDIKKEDAENTSSSLSFRQSMTNKSQILANQELSELNSDDYDGSYDNSADCDLEDSEDMALFESYHGNRKDDEVVFTMEKEPYDRLSFSEPKSNGDMESFESFKYDDRRNRQRTNPVRVEKLILKAKTEKKMEDDRRARLKKEYEEKKSRFLKRATDELQRNGFGLTEEEEKKLILKFDKMILETDEICDLIEPENGMRPSEKTKNVFKELIQNVYFNRKIICPEKQSCLN